MVDRSFDRAAVLRLLLFALVAGFSLWLGFFALEIHGAITLIRRVAYVVLLVALLGFGWFGFRILRGQVEALRAAFGRPIAWVTVLGVGWILFANQPPGYRTVLDEIVLSGTARQLHVDREPLFPHQAFYDRGELHVTGAYLDKRPLLFPFLVSLVHDATGYRVGNSFYLNLFLSFLLLAVAWAIGHALAGTAGGLFSTLLLGTLPLIPMLGVGGGFEIANALFAIVFFLGVWACLRDPNRDTVSFLVFATILLAHLRYESALFVFFAGLAILLAWAKAGKFVVPAALVAAPLFLVILPLQQQVFEQDEGLWQLGDVEGAEEVFSFSYLPDNLGHALNYFLSAEKYVPTSTLLFLFGCAGLVYGALGLRGWFAGGDPLRQATAVFWLALLVQALLILTYFWGQLDDPIIHRLSLPIWIWFWISSLWLFRGWLLGRPRLRLALLGTTAGFLLVFSLPVYSSHSYVGRHAPPEIFNRLAAWADENLGEQDLVLGRETLFWITMGAASFNPEDNKDRDVLFLERLDRHGLYEGIYVFERTKYVPESESFEAMDRMAILDRLETESVWEFAVDRAFGGRIRRVTAIDLAGIDRESEPPFANFINPDAVAKVIRRESAGTNDPGGRATATAPEAPPSSPPGGAESETPTAP